MAKRIVDEEMRFSVVINGNEAQAQLYKLEQRNRELNASSKELRAEKAKLAAQGKKNTAEYKALTAEISKNNLEVKQNKAQMSSLQKELGVTGLTMRQLKSRAAELRLQLSNMVEGSAQYKKLRAELSAVDAQLDKISLRSRAAESGISKLANGFNKYLALGASVIAIGTGVVLSIQKMIDYNGKLSDAQSNVQKTTGLTSDEVDKLTISLGKLQTRTPRLELLELAEEAGRLGIEGVKNIEDFVRVGNKLKVALGDDISTEQIREVGKMATVYKVAEKNGLSYGDALEALGSSINEVSASGANQAGFLVDYLKRQAGISIQTNLSAQDNIAYAATFDEIGQSVEVSATAMNKVWMDMFTNTEDYAKVAGMSVKDFSVLLNTDANAAMIKFLKGLNGNNEGLTILGERLKDLEVGGARGVQALSALSANTELLETRQKTANEALKEGTSLTNEYELKNNNLAATISKVQKVIYAAFSSQFIVSALSNLIAGIGDLLGVVDDVNESFEKETKVSYESAKANRKLADESQNLLDRYEELTADGIEPTAEAKDELDVITTRLKNNLGESVVAIDKETGALILNTEAVREQIKLKRLAADEEASTLASRLKGVEEKQKDLELERKLAQAEVDRQQKAFEFVNKEALEALKNQRLLSAREKADFISSQKGYAELQAAKKSLQAINVQILEQGKREVDLVEKLAELNFDRADIDALFKTNNPTSEGPTEGDTQIIDGVTFVFKGGKWVPVTYTPKPEDDKTKKSREDAAKKRADELKKESEELLKLQRESEDNRLALIQDAFRREMAINDENHFRKMEDLQAKIIENQKLADEALLKGDTDLASKYIDQNIELYNQMEQADREHQDKRNQILQQGIEQRLQTEQDRFQREEQARETAFNNELAALGDNERAKERLKKQFEKEKLERQKANEQILINELKGILDNAQFEDFSLELLTDEQLQILKDRLAQLGLSISEINALLAHMQGKSGDELGFIEGGEVDVLGFTQDQWNTIFENATRLTDIIGKIGNVMQAATQAYGIYNQFVTQNENKRLAEIERNAEKEKQKQKRLLDGKFISQKQHDDAVKAQDDKVNKAKAEMEYKQAKRQKIMNIAEILGNQAVAVSKALAQGGFVLGIPWAGIVAGLAGLQLALAVAQPLPAKGYEKGFYNNTMQVRREQDGRLFNAAYGGVSRSGVVDKPTVFLAGEGGKNFPEMIIDGRTLKQFNPDLKNSLYRELGRVRGFENGYYGKEGYQVPKEESNDSYAMFAAALNRNSAIMERLEENGVIAYISKDFQNLKKLRDELDRLKKYENKSQITS